VTQKYRKSWEGDRI